MDASSPIRFIRIKVVMFMVGLSRSSIYALMKTGLFPQQYKFQTRAVAWDEAEIQAWLASKKGGVK